MRIREEKYPGTLNHCAPSEVKKIYFIDLSENYTSLVAYEIYALAFVFALHRVYLNHESITELTYSDVKSIYDILEIRMNIVSKNPKHSGDGEIHEIISRQKIVWLELHSRTDKFKEPKFK